MSRQSIVLNTGQQAIVNTDTSKIFIGRNRYDKFTMNDYENSGYDDVTLVAGTIMGQLTGTGKVKALHSVATDGSQYPLGILAEDVVIEGGDTLSGREVQLCVEGDVAQEQLAFSGSDTLDTIISARTLRARIGADTVGIKLVATTEMTKEDNS